MPVLLARLLTNIKCLFPTFTNFDQCDTVYSSVMEMISCEAVTYDNKGKVTDVSYLMISN